MENNEDDDLEVAMLNLFKEKNKKKDLELENKRLKKELEKLKNNNKEEIQTNLYKKKIIGFNNSKSNKFLLPYLIGVVVLISIIILIIALVI